MLFTQDTIGYFLEKGAQEHPDRDFMVYPDRDLRLSYKEFDERVNLLAKGLLAIGIERGDHVGIWALNVPDWLTFMFATAKIGVVLVTVNTAYRSHELAYVMEQSDMKALAIIDGFRDIDYVQTVYELIPELKTQERGELKSETFPYLKSIIYIGPEKHR
jgi:fatty-acyl-CoA synthase